MGVIRDRVTSPEFSKLTALEKAKERPKLFQAYLDSDQGFAASYAEADDAGKQSMARQFTGTLDKEFPEQFSTTGWVWQYAEENPNLLDRVPVRAPVLDIESEKQLKGADTWEGRKELFDAVDRLPEDDPSKSSLKTLLVARIGVAPETWKIPEELTTSVKTRSMREVKIREASARVAGGGIRLGGTVITALAAGTLAVETGPGAIVAAAAGGAAGAQLSERPARIAEALITSWHGTDDYAEPTFREDVANMFLGGMIGPLQGPSRAMNALRQGAFGASTALVGQQIANPETALPEALKNAGAAGLIAAAFGGALPTSARAKPLPTSARAGPEVSPLAADIPPMEGIPAHIQKRRDDAIAAFTSAEMDGVSSRSPLYFEKLKQDLAAEADAALVREADFAKAKGEVLRKDLGKIEPTVGEGETIQLEGSEANKQRTVAMTRRGASAKEIARLNNVIEEELPFVPLDEPTPPLSSQAQRMHDKYGAVDAYLMANLAGTSTGGAIGFVRGMQEGETPEDRLFNAVVKGVRGAGIGFSLAYTGGKASKYILNPGEATRRARDMLGHMATGREDMPDWYLAARSTPTMQAIRTNFYSTLSKVKDAVSQLSGKGVDIPEGANPYLVGKLYKAYGRRIQDVVRPMFEESAKTIHTLAKGSPLGEKNFHTLFNNWMEAVHTPAYNAARIKADQPLTRFTEADVATILQQVEDQGLTDTFKNLKATTIDPMIAMDRQLRLDSGLISQETLDGFKRDFPNYVPFHRELGEEGAQLSHGSGLGSGKSVMSSGIRSAKGSDLPVSDILGSVTYNLVDATKRAARNEYGRSYANFVRLAEASGYPIPGVRVEAPTIRGESSDGSPIFHDTRANQLAFFDNGKKTHITFDDPILARDFGTYDDPKLTGIFRVWQGAMGIAASLKTKFSLNFLLANMPRDRGDAAVEAFSRGDIGGAIAMANPALALRDDFVPVVQHVFGDRGPGAVDVQRMMDAGGLPGGWASSTRMEYESYIKSLVDESALKKTALVAPRKVAELFNILGDISEGSTRYSAWRRAKQLGVTDPVAALAARDSSIDFDMKGRLTSQLALYRNFANPAIQSSVKAGKWVIRNPGVVPVLATGLGSMGMLVDSINSGYDENWKRARGMQYKRRNGFPFIYGKNEDTGEFDVFTFPIPQSVRPLKSIVDFSEDYSDGTLEGEGSVKRRLAETVILSLDAANPLGGSSSIMSSLTPSLIEPLVDVWANETFTGAPIVPNFQEIDPLQEEWSKFRPDLLDSWHGRMAIAGSTTLKEQFGIDISPQKALYLASQYGAGGFRTAEQLETIVGKLLSGEGVRAKDVPGLAGLAQSYKPVGDSESDPAYEENMLKVRSAVSEYAFKRNHLRYEADNAIEILKGKDNAAIAAVGRKLSDPASADVLEMVVSSLKREETDAIDTTLKMRPVEVRVSYVEKLFEALPDDEARRKMAETLQNRPWITEKFRELWRARQSAAPPQAPSKASPQESSPQASAPAPESLLQQLRASRPTE